MDEAELRWRLAGQQHRFGPGVQLSELRSAPAAFDDGIDLIERALVDAAVLVPILTGPHPSVLLTKRTPHLRTHAGQISFPGGRIDSGDASPEAAALREAHEEVGLDPSTVELVGRLGTYVTGTGYRIVPVIGLLPSDPILAPSPHEVEAVFRLPMEVVMDPSAPEKQRGEHRGRWREYWVWPHTEHHIWGATAAILVHLAHVLRGEP